MSENFKLYSRYYDLIYADKNYAAEAGYLIDLMKHYMPQAKQLLELGAGTGKHARIFADAGYEVLGVERSKGMVEIAQQNHMQNPKFVVSDIVVFETERKFDIALSLFHVISYINDNKDLIKTFKHTHQHLSTGGHFIFDVWHSSAVNHQKPEKREKVWKDEDLHILRKALPTIYPETNIVTVDYHIEVEDLTTGAKKSFSESHSMRHFSRSEIDLIAYATGFEVVHAEELISKNSPSIHTWGVCYILKKLN